VLEITGVAVPPELKGIPTGKARQVLESRGLNIGTIGDKFGGVLGAPSLVVTSTNPAMGTPVLLGSSVDINPRFRVKDGLLHLEVVPAATPMVPIGPHR
jgi:hypothetical protein